MNQENSTTPITMISSGSSEAPTHQEAMVGSTGNLEGSWYAVDQQFDGTASMNMHHTSTNNWSPAGAPSTISEVPEDGLKLPEGEVPPAKDGNGSASLAGSSQRAAHEATSQWGEDDTRAKNSTDEVLPTGVPRGLTQSSDSVRGSTKLAHSGSKSCHTPRGGIPSSVCATKGQPLSESLSSSIAICYDNDWVWFAMGAIAVAGVMFGGNRIYTSLQARTEGKAQSVSTRYMR